jgi:DNA-directed RNA polymerase subunit RPC12/RpoP
MRLKFKIPFVLAKQPIACPVCDSTSISIQRQRFKLLKKVSRGGALSGGLDFLPDGINENKNHRVCMECGKKF